MAMRVGWILKAGDFLRGSAELSAALRLLLLVLFLQKQEKYEDQQFVKSNLSSIRHSTMKGSGGFLFTIPLL